MMTRRFVRQFWRLEGVHGYSMDDAQATKMTTNRLVSTRVGSKSRLMDYLGLISG